MDTLPAFFKKTEINILYFSHMLRLILEFHKNYFWNYCVDIKELYMKINEELNKVQNEEQNDNKED